MSSDLVFHRCIEHIEVDYYFVRERVAKKLLLIDFVCQEIKLKWIYKSATYSTG